MIPKEAISTLDGLLKSLKWTPFSLFIILAQSIQWAISAQMFVMPAYLMPDGDTFANGTYTSARDEWPHVPRYFVFMDSYELISASEFAGSICFGMIPNLLSDRYGRKAVLVGVLIGIAVADTACALAPNYWFLILSRFVQGSFYNAIVTISFVHSMESVHRENRFIAYCGFGFFYTIGYCIIAPTALLIGSWRWIMAINGIAALLLAVVQHFLVPESLYFCVSENDEEKLEEVVKTAEWFNRRTYEVDCDLILKRVQSSNDAMPATAKIGAIHVYLFKNPPVRNILLVMCFSVSATFLSFAGLSLGSTSVEIYDVNWIFVLSGLVEFPAYCIAPIFLNWFPSKLVMFEMFTFASASLITLSFIQDVLPILYLVFWLVSKFFSTSCYMTALIVTSELFPTKFRSSAIGFVLAFSNFASIIAPHFEHLHDTVPDLAFLLFGVDLAIATFLVVIFIPMKTKFEV